MDTFVLIILGILVVDLVLLFVVLPCFLLFGTFWAIAIGLTSGFKPADSPSQARSSNILPTK